MKIVFLATMLALATTMQASAKVVVEQDSSHYHLKGLTVREIHHSLMHNAPREDGQIIEGEVADQFTVVFSSKLDGNACRPSDELVTLKLNILLPKWLDKESASSTVRVAWSRYMDKLLAHENGHKQIAISAANAIHRIIHTASGTGPCKAFDAKIKRAAEKVITDAEERQEAWEENTKPFGIE